MNAMTFRRVSPGAYDEATGTSSPPTETTIPGEGMFVAGDPQQYAAEELIPSVNPCVFFAPTAYPLKAFTPEFVMAGDRVLLNGIDFVVKKVLKVVAPDGFVVASRIAVGV
jgi:hypothetical protein